MTIALKPFRSPVTLFLSVLALSTIPAQAADTAANPDTTPKTAKVEKTDTKKASPNPRVEIVTSMGKIKVELYSDQAPLSTRNFLSYVKDKHYNGTIFHRVIKGFMIQGGDLTRKMKPKSSDLKPAIKNEASNGLKNTDGTLAMARTNDPDSATDQFFINVVDNPFLDYTSTNPGYAVFGKVIEGLDVAHKISEVPTTTQDGMSDVPVKPVLIKSIKVVRK